MRAAVSRNRRQLFFDASERRGRPGGGPAESDGSSGVEQGRPARATRRVRTTWCPATKVQGFDRGEAPRLTRVDIKRKELTTVPRLWKVCRQSNIFFTFLFQSKFRSKSKTLSSHSGFLLPKFHPALSSGHFTLIHPAVARKLTTKPLRRVVRRQFLPLS